MELKRGQLNDNQLKDNRLTDNQDKHIQHTGLGKELMKIAEGITRKNKFKKIAVISGVGVREYYKKIGYSLGKHYMIKEL